MTDNIRFINILFPNENLKRHNEKDIPAQQKEEKKDPWFSRSDEDQGWTAHHQKPQTETKKKTLPFMTETFSPQERIRKKKDFLHLYKKGSRYRGKYFNLIYLNNNLDFSRMATVVSRKVGNSVERNKIKRHMREIFRRNKEQIKDPVDMVIIPKKDILELDWTSLQKEYLAAVDSINQKH